MRTSQYNKMRTFENYTNQITFEDLIVGFDFITYGELETFYFYKTIDFDHWVFNYNKKFANIGLDQDEFYGLTDIPFDDFLKGHNFIYDHVELY